MKRILTLAIVLFFFFIGQNANSQTVWLNELNYDTPGTDSLEFVEVAGTAGTLLDNYSLLYVNGNGLATYLTQALSGTIPNEKNGLGAISFTFTVKNKIQNGPDGIALVKDGKEVIQFLSYKGKLSDWIFDNKPYTSDELPIEDGNDATDVSLQAGSYVLSPTSWTLVTPTPGKLNAGQGDIVLSLDDLTSFDRISLDSKEVEIYSIQGQKIEHSDMASGHVYLLRWTQGDTVHTQKILFDL